MSSSLSSPPLMLPASLTTFDSDQRITVGEYLAHRLLALHVDHVFGVPGDYSLGLCDQLINTGMRWVGCCSELNAGYAADAYARVRGLSAVCVTYGVGAFSLLNACAGAHAENVPMVVISGAPPSRNYKPNDLALPHHVLKGNMMSQMQAFHPVTTAATLLLTADGAAERIDETLCQSIAQCLPVLIEIPSDVAAMPIVGAAEKLAREPVSLWPTAPPHSSEACAAAVDRCRDALLAASRPALLVGLEVVRRGAQRSTRRLAQMLRLPVATTRHGKTAIEEGGTVCAGVYAGGGHSSEPVRNYVEGADVLLMLGAPKTDMDFFFSDLDSSRKIIIDVHGGTVTVHVPSSKGVEGSVHSSTEGTPANRIHTPPPLEIFGPVSLRAFIDALSLEIYDMYGDVTPLIPPLSHANSKDGGGAADASHSSLLALMPSPSPTRKLSSPPSGLLPHDGEQGEQSKQLCTWDGAFTAAITAHKHRERLVAAETDTTGGALASLLTGEAPLISDKFFQALEAWVHTQPVPVTVLADTGDMLFGSAEMAMRPNDHFITQAFYCSIGYTVPAAIGAAHAVQSKADSIDAADSGSSPAAKSRYEAKYEETGGKPARRIICLIGDGAFQMTGQEVSVGVRDRLPVTYIVLNNRGYGIERLIHAGPANNDYNNVPDWRYADFAKSFRLGDDGCGVAIVASNEGELASAFDLLNQPKHMATCNLLEVQVSNSTYSDALRLMGESLREENAM